MPHRSPTCWTFLVTLILMESGNAQTDASSRIQPITTQVKAGGTYHAATRTWTRTATPTANLTGPILYDNTCTVGFFVGLSAGESLVDSGRLPSTTSPASSTSVVGTADAYVIDRFEVAYCTSETAVTLEVAHFECYGAALCADQTLNTTLVSAIAIAGAPASASSGSLSCWTLQVDLRNSPLEFTMKADCDGVYGGGPSVAETFGWEYFQLGGGVSGHAGPLIAGDPFGLLTGTPCPFGAGTAFNPLPGPGTGLDTQDTWTSYLPGASYSSGSAFAGCFFFGGYTGGNLYGSFYHRIGGDQNCSILAFCPGDGSGSLCPFGNPNDGSSGLAGCANSAFDGGAKLWFGGCNSIDGENLVLRGSFLATCMNPTALFIQGNNALGGGNGVPFLDGLRCVGGSVVALQKVVVDSAGHCRSTVNIAAVGGVAPGDVRRYQIWYRDQCGFTGYNFSNGLEIAWAP